MTLLDFSFPIPSRSVFDKTVARDWYDGVTSGIAQSSQLGATFRFDIIAWGPSQEKRVFAFSPFEIGAFDKIVEILQRQELATWPIWFPEWPLWQPGESAQASEIKGLLSRVLAPQYAVASDSMFTALLAAKTFDNLTRKRLPTTYDGIPSSDSFQYWRSFLDLSDQ